MNRTKFALITIIIVAGAAIIGGTGSNATEAWLVHAQSADACGACHTLSESVPEGHFKATLNEVKYCLACHSLEGAATAFAWTTHQNHYSTLGVAINCWLCDQIDATGHFRLMGVEGGQEIPATQSQVTKMEPRYLSWATSVYLDRRHGQQSVTCRACHGTYFPERRPATEQCYTCHGSYQLVASLTEDVEPNPHASHLGEIRCTICHKSHEKSVLYCNQCHLFDLEVP